MHTCKHTHRQTHIHIREWQSVMVTFCALWDHIWLQWHSLSHSQNNYYLFCLSTHSLFTANKCFVMKNIGQNILMWLMFQIMLFWPLWRLFQLLLTEIKNKWENLTRHKTSSTVCLCAVTVPAYIIPSPSPSSWTLTFWPQNLTPSSLSHNTLSV